MVAGFLEESSQTASQLIHPHLLCTPLTLQRAAIRTRRFAVRFSAAVPEVLSPSDRAFSPYARVYLFDDVSFC